MTQQALVLDANILVRAVLGRKVFGLINQYSHTTAFFAPDDAFMDAAKYLPQIFGRRKLDWAAGLTVLNQLPALIQPVEVDIYREFEEEARARIRDEFDWPVLATSLMLKCPIWTEDADFFGSGVPTWTTDKVHLYLHGAAVNDER